MSDSGIPVTEDEIHAYVDGELPAERHGAVEAWLASHPQDAARVADWRAMADAIRARYGAVADEPVPPRLHLEALTRRPARWMMGAAAAALIAFAAGGGIGWLAHGAAAAVPDPAETLRGEAAAAHRLYIGEVRHPVEVRAGETHLLPWLSRRLGTTLTAPDLSGFDLRLLGGRLLPGVEGPAALFMYEATGGERVTIYCSALKARESAFAYRSDDSTASVSWIADSYGWVVSGPQERERLREIATAAWQQMETGGK